MSGADQFRDMLEAGDLAGLRRAWAVIAPHLPQNLTDAQAEVVMHRTRTETGTISLKARAWSHRWLCERLLPSGLPDALKPQAERMYPRVVSAVGIGVRMSNPLLKPAAVEIRTAMEHAVENAFADGRTDTPFVRARMKEARVRVEHKLFG